jgi:hypothetical protein
MAKDTVQPGDPFEIRADTWNALLEGHRRMQSGELAPGSAAARPDLELFFIKNNTGAALDRFAVVGLGAPLWTPAAALDSFKQSRIVLAGAVPTTAHAGRFAILKTPAPAGSIAPASAFGITQCRVNITSTTHTLADVEAGSTARLVSSGTAGAASILWFEGGTGEQWAVVAIGTRCAAP